MKMKAPEGLMKYLNETVRNGNEMVSLPLSILYERLQ